MKCPICSLEMEDGIIVYEAGGHHPSLDTNLTKSSKPTQCNSPCQLHLIPVSYKSQHPLHVEWMTYPITQTL